MDNNFMRYDEDDFRNLQFSKSRGQLEMFELFRIDQHAQCRWSVSIQIRVSFSFGVSELRLHESEISTIHYSNSLLGTPGSISFC
jgi:hypothetical protein